MDPNGDNDLSDHLDVINMSLGSSFGGLTDTSSIAADNAARAGVIVVVLGRQQRRHLFHHRLAGLGQPHDLDGRHHRRHGRGADAASSTRPAAVAGNYTAGNREFRRAAAIVRHDGQRRRGSRSRRWRRAVDDGCVFAADERGGRRGQRRAGRSRDLRFAVKVKNVAGCRRDRRHRREQRRQARRT